MPAATYIDYGSIHSALKTAIVTQGATASGFKYCSSEKWFNLEFGIFPDALKGQSFTIKFLSTETSAVHSTDWIDINVGVEFLLDCNKDKYLNKIDNIHKCLDNFAETADSNTNVMSQHNSDQFEWTSTYLQDKVLLSFIVKLTTQVRSDVGGV